LGERAKLVRSLAERTDPFVKARLIKLAERYENELSMRSPTANPRAPRRSDGDDQGLMRDGR